MINKVFTSSSPGPHGVQDQKGYIGFDSHSRFSEDELGKCDCGSDDSLLSLSLSLSLSLHRSVTKFQFFVGLEFSYNELKYRSMLWVFSCRSNSSSKFAFSVHPAVMQKHYNH